MRASALFLMGSIAVLLLGLFNSFLAQASPIRMATDTPLLALARLHYLFWGVGIFVLGALIHVPGADCARRESASKLGFWLMFLGFNLAFFPTTLRRSPVPWAGNFSRRVGSYRWRPSTPVRDVPLAADSFCLPLPCEP